MRTVIRLRTVLGAAALMLATASISAQNWPSFRGPNASGVSNGPSTALKWNVAGGENVLWKTPVPGMAVSSPVVWGDRVFVSTAVSSDPNAGIKTGLYGDVKPSSDLSMHSWRLLSLDKRTGKVLWERVAHEGTPKTKRHPKSSQASATPVTDGRHVVVSFGSEGLYAYDFDGKQIWKRDLGVLNAGWFYDPDYEWGIGSSPIIWKNSVIVQCDIQKNSFVAAFDVATGRELWRTAREEIPSWSTPTVYERDGDRVHARLRSGDG
jgi:outer membrane protein assembly factor BamB